MVGDMPNFYTYYKLIGLIIVAIALVSSLVFRVFKFKQKPNIDYILLCTGLIIITSLISTILSKQLDVSIWGFYSRAKEASVPSD